MCTREKQVTIIILLIAVSTAFFITKLNVFEEELVHHMLLNNLLFKWVTLSSSYTSPTFTILSYFNLEIFLCNSALLFCRWHGKSKTSEKGGEHIFSETVGGFVERSSKLENAFSR